MAKALKIVAVVTAVAAIAIVTGGAAAGLGLTLSMSAFGVSAGALLAASAVLSTAGSLLSPKPKAPTTSSSNADRLSVSIDTRAPRKIILGTTAMATDLRDQEWSADQSFLDRFIACASHRVQAIREIWFDDVLAWSATGGIAAKYAGYLTVTPVLEGGPANAIVTSARMGSTRRYTGLAYVHLRYKLTGNSKKAESPFASTIPTRMTIVGDGALFYDPRRDSTVVGGSGPMRANDQATWVWDASACRNPALALLFYLLGWRIRNPSTGAMKLAVGKGLPASRIDLASFITAANICDEPVTRKDGVSEPRYRCDGIFSEADDPRLVLDNLKATMNAVLDDVDGRIRLSVLYNDLATPAGDLTAADVLGEFTWLQTPPLTDSVNVIRGGYTDPSPASLYQLVDFPEVRIASPDGIDRPQTVNLPLVQSGSQAQRLVRLRLARALYAGQFTAVFQATAWKFQKGDVIRLSFYPLGWDKKLFRIADMAIQVDGTVPMMLREENAAIYAAYNDEAAAIAGAAPTTYDPGLWPIIQGIRDVDNGLNELTGRVTRAASDGWLDTGEKRDARIAYQALADDWNAKRALAMTYEGKSQLIGNARVAADTAIYALGGYLNGLVPSWLDTSVDTSIDPATYRNRWGTAYAAVAELTAQLSLALGPDVAAVTARVDRVASDGWLTAGEKPAERIAFQAINDDWSAKRGLAMTYEAKSAAIGAARVAADTAVYALGGYLNGLVPSWIDTAADTAVDPATYRNTWGAAYARLSDLTTQLSLALGPDLQAVTARVDRVASDGWLDIGEKRAARIDYQALSDEWTALRTKSTSGGLEAALPAMGAARVAADNAMYALLGYLNSLVPSWLDMGSDTPVDAVTYRSSWGTAYQRVADLSAAVAASASWSQLVDDNGRRPEDNATAGANLIYNGGAELVAPGAAQAAPIAGWYVDPFINGASAIDAIADVPRTGSRAIRLIRNGSVGGWVSRAFSVTPGERIVITAAARGASGNGTADFAATVQWKDSAPANGVYITSNDRSSFDASMAPGVSLSATYTVFSKTFVVPVGMTWANMSFYCADRAPAIVYVDDVVAVRAAPGSQNIDLDTGRAVSSRFLTTGLLIGLKAGVSDVATATDQGSGTGATISIPSHTRTYAGAAGPVSVGYTAGSLTNRSYDTLYYVFADDPALAGGAVTYQTSTDYVALAYPGRVHVATIVTPTSGGTAATGGGGGGSGATGTSSGTGGGGRLNYNIP